MINNLVSSYIPNNIRPSSFSILDNLIIADIFTDVTIIEINGDRYTNMRAFANLLGISQIKESLKAHKIETLSLKNLLKDGNIDCIKNPQLVKISQVLGYKGKTANASLMSSLWLTDSSAREWTLTANTEFAKNFRKHVLVVYENYISSISLPATPIPIANISANMWELAQAWTDALKDNYELSKTILEQSNQLNESNRKVTQLENKIDTHTLFGKSPILVQKEIEYYTIEELTKLFLVSSNTVSKLLHYSGHPKKAYKITLDDYNKASYVKEGVVESFKKALAEAETTISNSKKTLVVKHPAFNGNIVLFKKDAAIKWFNYSLRDFL